MTDAELFAPAQAVEALLEEALAQRGFPGNLYQAVHYTLLGGGKRLRPVLTVRVCEALGGAAEDALPAAAALELIHAASLVHDDLPAMDDDDVRRGRATLHVHAGEAMAILAGDAMLTFPYELVMTRTPQAADGGQVCRELARATGDMIAGQVHDTLPDFDAQISDAERLKIIHRNKTGALLACACRCGALAAGQPADTLDAFAEAIGVLFQAVDDLLDETQSAEVMGKATGKDAAMGKLTYPVVHGIAGTRAEIAAMRAQALDALAGLGQAAQPLRELACFIADREH